MPIQFPADPAAQSPVNQFSPSSTPDANTTNDYIYQWVTSGTTGYWTAFASGDGGNGTTRGGGDDLVFQENQMVCTEDYTISDTWSAVSAGPIEIEDGVSIEVPDNQSWVVL